MQNNPWPRAEVCLVTLSLVLTKIWARCTDRSASVWLLSVDLTRPDYQDLLSAALIQLDLFACNFHPILCGHRHKAILCNVRKTVDFTCNCHYLTCLATASNIDLELMLVPYFCCLLLFELQTTTQSRRALTSMYWCRSLSSLIDTGIEKPLKLIASVTSSVCKL